MQFLNNLFFSKLEEQFNKLSNISNLFLLKKEKVYTPKKKIQHKLWKIYIYTRRQHFEVQPCVFTEQIREKPQEIIM